MYGDHDEDDTLEISKTLSEIKFNYQQNPNITKRVNEKLIPLLTSRAIESYQNNFYSRENKIQAEVSLNYFESLFHFAILNGVFFIINTILLIRMKFASVNLYFIKLDKIDEFGIFIGLLIIFLSVVILSVFIFRFSITRIEIFLPYVLPILFTENKDEKYLRRQTIRSLLSFDMDNLLERRDQHKYGKLINSSIEKLVEPLLNEELLITASKEFAHKIAWREYSALIQNDLIDKGFWQSTPLERLFIGLKIGDLQIDYKDLFGMNSDLEFILDILNNWKKKSKDTKLIAYFRLYRVVEYIIKEIGKVLDIRKESDESVYTILKVLYDMKKIDSKQLSMLQELRHRRNKLMHQPGISLQISREVFIENIDILNFLLEGIENL